MNEGSDGCCVAFKVTHETTVLADPCKCSFDDPALWQNDETFDIGSLDDLDFPAPGRRNGSRHFWSLVSRVGKDFRDERETPPRMLQQTVRSIAILYVCRQDAYAEQEPERVDKNMAFAADDLLARVETLRINRCAPF